jgi:hypothetical protein
MIQHDDRHLREADLFCRLEATMPCNDARACVDEDWVEKTELSDAGRDLIDLFRRMGARIFVVRNEFITLARSRCDPPCAVKIQLSCNLSCNL